MRIAYDPGCGSVVACVEGAELPVDLIHEISLENL
jgi:hypothetical protein